MGRYITYDELIIRYPLINTWSEKESHVNSFIIHYAENEVDQLLAPAYSTPFSAGHATVKDLSFDVCKYKVLMDQDVDKSEKLWSIIIEKIDRLLSGEAQIITDSGALAPTQPGAEIWSNTKDYTPTHSMLDEDNAYTHIDSTMLSDMESERM